MKTHPVTRPPVPGARASVATVTGGASAVARTTIAAAVAAVTAAVAIASVCAGAAAAAAAAVPTTWPAGHADALRPWLPTGKAGLPPRKIHLAARAVLQIVVEDLSHCFLNSDVA